MNRQINGANLEVRRGIIAVPGLSRGLWSYMQPTAVDPGMPRMPLDRSKLKTSVNHRRFLSDVAQPQCWRATRHGRAGREGIVH
jgi:hypothetical protein